VFLEVEIEVTKNQNGKEESDMVQEGVPQNGGRKSRFLFLRRDRGIRQETEIHIRPISSMTPSEITQEIILRVRALQRKGLLPCSDPSVLNSSESKDVATSGSKPAPKLPGKTKKFVDFRTLSSVKKEHKHG